MNKRRLKTEEGWKTEGRMRRKEERREGGGGGEDAISEGRGGGDRMKGMWERRKRRGMWHGIPPSPPTTKQYSAPNVTGQLFLGRKTLFYRPPQKHKHLHSLLKMSKTRISHEASESDR